MRASATLLAALLCAFVEGKNSKGKKLPPHPPLPSKENTLHYCYEDGHLHRKQSCRFFAVVIDGGSTGTRMQLYRFVHGTDDHATPFQVENEAFHEVKPGLSSFISRPEDVSVGLEELLGKAREAIPERLWTRTPVTLKATAGLRLLPGDAAKRILAEAERVVRASGFVCMDDCVGILDGKDEGVFSWFTLNLLLQRFNHDDNGVPIDPQPNRSLSAFDLGGGSTQVTYWPLSDSIFSRFPEDRHDIDFFDTHMHLFSKSFLGNGLQSARLGVLRGSTGQLEEGEERMEMASECFPPDYTLREWEQALRQWTIRGTTGYSYEQCAQSVQQFVRLSEITKLTDLHDPKRPIFLFSYFFDRAKQNGLIDEKTGWSRLQLRTWKQAAETACNGRTVDFSNRPHWYPWQCMDLSYIYALLKEGYGFSDEQEMVLAQSVRGMGLSWAQGLSYALVDAYHSHLALEDIDDDGSLPLSVDQQKRDKKRQRRFQSQSPGSPAIERRINATGVEIVDNILSLISQRTTDVLQFFNILS